MTYQHYLKLSKYKIIKFESPDFIVWQENNDIGKIGLETSRPDITTENLGRKLSEKYFLKGLTHKEMMNKMVISEKRFLNYGEIQEVNNTNYISFSKGMTNTTAHHKLICDGIRNKTKKLNGNYTLFNKNVLYLFPFSSFLSSEEDIVKIGYFISNLVYEFIQVFDEIVIDTYDRLVLYERKVDKYKHRVINLDSTISKVIQDECNEVRFGSLGSRLRCSQSTFLHQA